METKGIAPLKIEAGVVERPEEEEEDLEVEEAIITYPHVRFAGTGSIRITWDSLVKTSKEVRILTLTLPILSHPTMTRIGTLIVVLHTMSLVILPRLNKKLAPKV